MPDHPATDEDEELISKSQLKREALAMREIGVRITDLSASQRAQVPQSDALRRALEEFDRIRSREARRRHLSFIGKVLRNEDLDAITAVIEAFDTHSATHTRALHALEAWRAALLASDSALGDFLGHVPGADRPRLRACIRAARRELEQDQSPKPQRRRYRDLFKLLKAETAELGELPAPPSSD